MSSTDSTVPNGLQRPARAILVGVDFGRGKAFDDTLDELALLAESAGDIAVARVIARRKAPDAALFVGSGKADEIKALVLGHQAEAVLSAELKVGRCGPPSWLFRPARSARSRGSSLHDPAPPSR